MKKMIAIALAVVTMGAGLLMAPAVMAAVTCPDGSANDTADNIAGCNLKSTSGNIWDTVNTIINVIIGILGLVTVIVIIYGGFQYTTSAGDANKAQKAKSTIIYGVVGLVIALLAFTIVNFVLTSVFSGPDYASAKTEAECGALNPPGKWNSTTSKCVAP